MTEAAANSHPKYLGLVSRYDAGAHCCECARKVAKESCCRIESAVVLAPNNSVSPNICKSSPMRHVICHGWNSAAHVSLP